MAATNTAFVELETGMHYLKGGQWLESKAEIELLADGAAATNGPHQVFFAANLNTAGAVDLTTPDGQRLRSRVFGLSYFDASTGKAVLIGETKDSIGLLVGANRVVYTNAFEDAEGVDADVEYVVTKAGLEQNVVLRSQLPSPGAFNMNPASTRLQVLTEFYAPPVPAKTTELQAAGIVDEFLDFGTMTMGRGRAFSVGAAGETGGSVPVSKQWGVASGRTFLVEQVPFELVEKQIQALERKKQGASLNLNRQGQGMDVLAALQGVLPKRRAKASAGKMRLAQLEKHERAGFVLDYTLLSSATNFTFQGDKTYYVSGTVNLSSTTTIEGGTIVKFTNSTSAKINLIGSLNCQTDPYRPAVFTSKDDNTVGETITGSTGNPTNYNGGTYLYGGGNPTYKYLRFSYAGTAIYGSPDTGGIWHCQFLRCGTAIQSADSDITLRNVLFSKCDTAVSSTYGGNVVRGEQVTADQLNKFFDCLQTSNTGKLTNSIFTAVTNLGQYVTLYNCVTNSSGNGIYGRQGSR